VKGAVVAFAFGAPSTLLSNRLIAGIAGNKAKSLGIPVYTQRDVTPLETGIQIELTEEDYPKRVPTLRIARGAIKWTKQHGIDEVWLCAAKPHLARAARDFNYALEEENACINVKVCEEIHEQPHKHWFCEDSVHIDTRFWLIWKVRDAVLMYIPTWLYSLIAN
jgi:hypothetical protein